MKLKKGMQYFLILLIFFLIFYILYVLPKLFLIYESDAAYPGFLWYGIKEYGIDFLLTIKYTHANWLFTLMVFYFILFSFLKPTLPLIFTIGWFIFTLNAILLSFILKKILNITFRSNIVLVLLIVLLFIDYINITTYGFFYPVTHNSTFTWVLLSILITIWLLRNEGNKTKNFIFLLLISTIVAIAGFSDAWFHAVYSLPSILSFLCLILINYRNKNLVLKLSFIILFIIIGWITAYTKFWGFLDFVSDPYYQFVTSIDRLRDNLFIYSYALLSFFGILQSLEINKIFGFFVLFIFFLLLILLVIWIFKFLSLYIKKLQFLALIYFIIFLIFSIFSISTSFILYDLNVDLVNSRYLINIYYFIFILIMLFIYLNSKSHTRFSFFVRKIAILFLFIYVCIIFIDNFKFLIKPKRENILEEINKEINTGLSLLNKEYKDWVINFLLYNTQVAKYLLIEGKYLKELLVILKNENLKLGYGFYFETYPHVINTISEGRIKIGAISELLHMRAQTSSFLFRKSKIKEEKSFLVIPKFKFGLSDKYSYNKILRLSELLFGKPTKVIDSSNYKLLIWNYKIYAQKPSNIIKLLIKGVKDYLIDGNRLENLSFKVLISKGYVDEVFGFNQKDPRWSIVGPAWVGEWKCRSSENKCVGIGVIDFIDNLEEVVDKYKDKAEKIYFPYPKSCLSKCGKEHGLLLLIFKISDLIKMDIK